MHQVTIKNLEKSTIEIEGEISVEKFETYRPAVIKRLNQELSFDGFRKGNAPEKMVVDKVGEENILFDMAELALQDAYPEIILEQKLDVIGRPAISLTKVASGNPLGFKIKTALMPKLELPNYSQMAEKIASEKEEVIEISEDEVNKVLEDIRKQRALTHHHHDGNCDHDHEKEPELPELNDDFAKSLGQFQDLADLRAKIKENLDLEKKHQIKEKKRMTIVEGIRTETKLELPDILIESELDKMLAELAGQIEGAGLKFEDYLTHLKKTKEELKEAWRADAEKRVAISLILTEIAAREKITPTEEELEKEINYLTSHYQGVDTTRARAYATTVLTNEKTFAWLEEGGSKK